VTSPHSLASAAGVDVLRAGGSAIDAAIAAGGVLAVVYPHMTSLGGDAFWLIHDGRSGEIKYLNGGGRAAASACLSWFEGKGMNEIPFRGIIPATLTIPGAVASWTEARFPSSTLSKLERRGHLVSRWGLWNEMAGHAHGIIVNPETGTLAGGADPRSDGAAIGY